MIYALHGMMGHHSDWDVLGLNLQSVDLWKSACGDETNSGLEYWSQAFNGGVSQIEPKILIGYSMGGRLALHAMLDQPSSWSGAVIISTHPGLQNNEEKESRVVSDQQWAARAREWAWVDFIRLWNEQAVLKSGSGSLIQSDLEGSRENVACAFECWSLGQQEDLRPALAQCKTPVLWITGGQDEKFTLLASEVTSNNENFEHEIIQGAGHRLLFENGEPMNTLKTLIGDFKKQIL